jgi:type IV pilus assembly PilX-like protein
MKTREQGATLLVVLVMLVVITLLGIAGIRMSSSSLLIIGNMQSRKFVENWALQGIEQVMTTITPFNAPTSAVAVPAPSGVTVAVSTRICQYSTPAAGYSAIAAIVPEDNQWEFDVTVNDSFTGARARMVQGVKIRQLAGSCV